METFDDLTFELKAKICELGEDWDVKISDAGFSVSFQVSHGTYQHSLDANIDGLITMIAELKYLASDFDAEEFVEEWIIEKHCSNRKDIPSVRTLLKQGVEIENKLDLLIHVLDEFENELLKN